MGTPGPAPEVTLADTLGAFDGPRVPLTTTEIAEELGCARRTAFRKLERLAERGELRTKKVGASGRVWWRPETVAGPDGSGGYPGDPTSFDEFVRAVEDYAIFTLDPTGHVISWNEGARRIKGYDEAAIIGEHFSAFYTDDDNERDVPRRNLEAAREQGRIEDEGWRVRADGTEFWANVVITAIYDDDGALRGFTKVTRDLTERKRADDELERERATLDRILAAVPMSVIVIGRDGGFERMNDRARDRLGVDDVGDASIGDWPVYDADGELIPPEERPYARVFETGEAVHDWECQIELPRGRVWASVTAVPLGDEDPPERIVVAANNITQLKEQAQRLERRRDELEAELDEVFDRVDDAFYALDEDWRFTHVNRRAEALIQQSEAAVLGESLWEVFPAAAEGPVWDRFHEAVDSQESVSFEHRFESLGVWAEINAYPSATGLSVYFRDVSDRKARERELQRYERIVETIDDGVYTVDAEGRYSMVNEAYVEMTGYDREALVGAPVSLLADEETIEAARDLEAELADGERETARLEADLLRADGGTVRAEATFAMLPGEDEPERVGVVRDVTERVERERALEESERRYRTLVENFPNGAVTLFDEDLRFVAVGGENIDTQDQDAEALVGERIEDVVPAGLAEQYVPQYRAAVEDGERNRFDVEYEGRHYQFRSLPVRDADGEVFAGMGVSVDVTERVERERALEESEELHRTLIENVPAGGIGLVDRDLRYEVVGGDVFELVGLSAEEVEGRRIDELYDDALADLLTEKYGDALAGEATTFEVAVGSREMEMRTVPVRDSSGEVIAALGMTQDITERKARERRLERYETLVETVDDGIYALDEELRFTMVNEAYAEMVGYPRAELLGAHISSVVDDADVEMAERLREQLRSGELPGGTVEVDVTTAAGEAIPTETAFAPLWIEGETFAGTVGVVRDITERKERDRELERTLDLLEKTERIADVGGWEIDVETMDVFWSGHLFDVLEVPYDEEPPLDAALDVYHEDDRPLVEDAVEAALEAGEPFDVEARFRTPDGDVRWLRIQGEPETADGEVVSLRGAAQDVTERKERERQLEQFHRMVETATDGIYATDGDGRFVYVNDAFAEMSEHAEVELLGAHGSAFFGDRFVDTDEPAWRQLVDGERDSVEYEAEIVGPDGSRRVVHNQVVPLEIGDEIGRVGVTRDISQRKAYERELRRYETLIEESTDVNAILDDDGTIQYVTPSVEFVLGYEPDDLVGENAFDYLHPADREPVRDDFVAIVEGTDRPPMTEFRFRHADGSWAWLESRSRNLRDDPSVDGVVVYTREVTERKAHERQLEARAHQQSVIAELGHFALEHPGLDELFAEASNRLVEALDADYCQVLDLDPVAGELRLRGGVGWRDGSVGHHAVPDDDGSQAGYTLLSSEPVVVEDLDAEGRFSAPDLLTDHDVSSGVTALIGSVDEPWGVLGVHDAAPRTFSTEVVDFVQSVANILAEAIERQGYQDDLEELVAELEESNERLEQFAYVASHDLQEPLRMVSNYLQLVEDRYADQLDEDGQEFIDFAVSGADRMREMINGLLSYSRVDTQAEPPQAVDCNALLERTRRNLELQIEESDAAIEVGQLPTVRADANQLEQVFQNLLSNAIKYRDGTPEIEVGAHRDGDEWVFRVADDGIGIDPERTDSIFQVFRRLHTHEEYPGAGIGLALCKKIVERHGGDIWVESEPGVGSTFYFTIPAGEVARLRGPARRRMGLPEGGDD